MKRLQYIGFLLLLIALVSSCAKDELESPTSGDSLYYQPQERIDEHQDFSSETNSQEGPLEINDDEDDESGPEDSPDIE